MNRALSYVKQQQWLITPEALQVVVEVASRENRDLAAIEKDLGKELRNTETVRIRDGVAVIPVHGPLVRYGNLFSRISGATSLEMLATDFSTALESSEVRAIVLDVDSPGGQVNGTEELAELIYQARGIKPVVAHVSGFGASAAYWLASAAEQVTVGRTAVLGSIGALLVVTDYSEADKKDGIREIKFVSRSSPRKALDPATEEGAEDIQRMVDHIGDAFVAAVARNRGVTPETVVSDFGAGGVLVGEHAVEMGLADHISTLEVVIAGLVEGGRMPGASVKPGLAGAHHPKAEEIIMAKETTAAEAPVLTVAQIREQYPEAAAALLKEGLEEGVTAGKAMAEEAQATAVEAARTDERERILGIEALHGSRELKDELKREGVSVAEAALRINEAQKAAARGQLDGLRQHEQENEAPSPSGSADGEDEVSQVVAFIMNAGAGAHQIPAGKEA